MSLPSSSVVFASIPLGAILQHVSPLDADFMSWYNFLLLEFLESGIMIANADIFAIVTFHAEV